MSKQGQTGKSLIIVESPAKIKTLQKFLGPNYIFESSIGHIRDLPEKEFGIDIENDFEPKYVVSPNKKDVVKKLTSAAKKCDTIYLSPDPDREGEAIAWHIAQILPEDANIKRVSFNSITKDAVVEALDHPREIDKALVDAQQARRLLDRIVGYKISPILNRRMQRGRSGSVSAGRVQSVALKLVVEREKEIMAFNPVEYWNLSTLLTDQEHNKIFSAYLYSVDGKKVEKEPIEGKDVTLIGDKEKADFVVDLLNDASYQVAKVEKKEKKRNPVPPFITSTLQQEASRHHGYSSARTMSIAQGLYEGLDLGNEGTEGLITYMRTDSVRIAPEALTAARDYIKSTFGPEFLPEKANSYSTKKTAQDAHEAIRPTNLAHPPEKVKDFLDKDQFNLYSLVWKRFIASQMNPAVYDTVSADISTDNNLVLRVTGSIIKFPGFLKVYEEKGDDEEEGQESKELPELEVGASINLKEVKAEQAFTKPPPRYSEASLVKALEKSGIGRPSTYTSIMNKIQSREYTIKENKRLKPTELGIVIAEMLENHFTNIMNVDFTASMEDSLERVALNEKNWKSLLEEFWKDFEPTLETAEKEAHVPKIPTDLDCPKCGAKLQKVWFRSKYFYGCSKYPDCDFSAPIEQLTFDKNDYAEDFDWDQKCPECQEEMVLRHGRFGAFLGCSKYPDCRGIVNIPKKGEVYIKQEDLPSCPAIDCPGRLVARKSRFGKTFFSCSTFPDCDVIVNDLDDLHTKYPNHPRTAYSKPKRGRKGAKTTKGGKKTTAKAKKERKPRNEKPNPLSPELTELIGVNELPRSQVIKKVWEYIKAHELQDPSNKRIIKPDDKLAKIFGSNEPIEMFHMTKLLSQHIYKIGSSPES